MKRLFDSSIDYGNPEKKQKTEANFASRELTTDQQFILACRTNRADKAQQLLRDYLEINEIDAPNNGFDVALRYGQLEIIELIMENFAVYINPISLLTGYTCNKKVLDVLLENLETYRIYEQFDLFCAMSNGEYDQEESLDKELVKEIVVKIFNYKDFNIAELYNEVDDRVPTRTLFTFFNNNVSLLVSKPLSELDNFQALKVVHELINKKKQEESFQEESALINLLPSAKCKFFKKANPFKQPQLLPELWDMVAEYVIALETTPVLK